MPLFSAAGASNPHTEKMLEIQMATPEVGAAGSGEGGATVA